MKPAGLETRIAALESRCAELERQIAGQVPVPATHPRKELAIRQIVADFYGLSTSEMLTKRRTVRLCWPRFTTMFLTKRHTALCHEQIAHLVGLTNHGSVTNGLEQAENQYNHAKRVNGPYFREIQELERRIHDSYHKVGIQPPATSPVILPQSPSGAVLQGR